MADTLDYSERLTRHCLLELPDGEATFTDWIDDDQIDADVPIKLVCTVRKKGDTMEVDWTGSNKQVKGAINNTFSYTAAMSFTAVKSVLSLNMPNNDGVFRPVTVIAPEAQVTIKAAALKSKSKNTPFDGWLLRRAQMDGAQVRQQKVARIRLGDQALVDGVNKFTKAHGFPDAIVVDNVKAETAAQVASAASVGRAREAQRQVIDQHFRQLEQEAADAQARAWRRLLLGEFARAVEEDDVVTQGEQH